MPDADNNKNMAGAVNPEVSSGPVAQPIEEKIAENEMAARASQHLSDTAAELERDRGISVWMYGIALILLMFLAAIIFLTAVASSPTPR
jgi:hypothetical protein